MTVIESTSIYAPARWGLSAPVIADLGARLHRTWERYRACFKTKTQDPSAHAFTYLRGLLGLDTERNYANIARRVNGLWDDGQASNILCQIRRGIHSACSRRFNRKSKRVQTYVMGS